MKFIKKNSGFVIKTLVAMFFLLLIIFLFKEQSSAIADGSSDVFSSNYFSSQVSDLEEEAVEEEAVEEEAVEEEAVEEEAVEEEAVEEDTAESRSLRVDSTILLSDGDILLLNENGYYTITSERTAISEVVWESITTTYNNETKVFVDSNANVSILTVNGVATIESIIGDSNSSIVNILANSNLVVDSTSDAIFVNSLYIGDSYMSTNTELTIRSEKGRGISFVDYLLIHDGVHVNINSLEEGVFCLGASSSVPYPSGVLMIGSRAELSIVSKTQGISTIEIALTNADLTVESETGGIVLERNLMASYNAEASRVPTIAITTKTGIALKVEEVIYLTDYNLSAISTEGEGAGIYARTIYVENYYNNTHFIVKADKGFGITGNMDSYDYNFQVVSSATFISSDIATADIKIFVNEGIALSVFDAMFNLVSVEIIAEKGIGCVAMGNFNILDCPKILFQSNGSTPNHFNIDNTIPDSVGLNLFGQAYVQGSDLEMYAPINDLNSYGLHGSMLGIDGTMVMAGQFWLEGNSTLNAKGGTGISVLQMSVTGASHLTIEAFNDALITTFLAVQGFDTDFSSLTITGGNTGITIDWDKYIELEQFDPLDYGFLTQYGYNFNGSQVFINNVEKGFKFRASTNLNELNWQDVINEFVISDTIFEINAQNIGMEFDIDSDTLTNEEWAIVDFVVTNSEINILTTGSVSEFPNATGFQFAQKGSHLRNLVLEDSFLKAEGNRYGVEIQDTPIHLTGSSVMEGIGEEIGFITSGVESTLLTTPSSPESIQIIGTSRGVAPDKVGRKPALLLSSASKPENAKLIENYVVEAENPILQSPPYYVYADGMNILNPSDYAWSADISELEGHVNGVTAVNAATGTQKVTALGESTSTYLGNYGNIHEVHLYAKINQYAVTFDAAGGSPTPPNQYVDVNDLITMPTGVTYPGYTLEGWYEPSGSTGELIFWDFSVDRMPDRNVTLIAKWSLVSDQIYKVIFDGNGGVPEYQDVLVKYEEKVLLPEVEPTRSLSKFTGWYKNAEATEVWNFDLDTMPNHDLTLYAGWEKEYWEIHFDLNGGQWKDAVETMVVPANQPIDIEFIQPGGPNAPFYENHVFIGWTDQNGNVIQSGVMADQDYYLKANWIGLEEIIQNQGEENIVIYKNEATVEEVEGQLEVETVYTDLLGNTHRLDYYYDWNHEIISMGGIERIRIYVIDSFTEEKYYSSNQYSYIYVLNRPYITGNDYTWIFVGGELDLDIFDVRAYGEVPNFSEKRIDRLEVPLTFDGENIDIWKVGTYNGMYYGTFDDYFKNLIDLEFLVTVKVVGESSGINTENNTGGYTLNRDEQRQVDSSYFWVKVTDIYHQMKPGQVIEINEYNYMDGGRLLDERIPEEANYDRLIRVTPGPYIIMNPCILDRIKEDEKGQMDVYLPGRELGFNSADFDKNINYPVIGYYDLRMSVISNEVIEETTETEHAKMQLEFNMNRSWLGKVRFIINPNDLVKNAIHEGNTPYLFHFNENTQELELIGEMNVLSNEQLEIFVEGFYKNYVILTELPNNGGYRITDKTNEISNEVYRNIQENQMISGKNLPEETIVNSISTIQYQVMNSTESGEIINVAPKSNLGTLTIVIVASGLGMGIFLFWFFYNKKRKTSQK